MVFVVLVALKLCCKTKYRTTVQCVVHLREPTDVDIDTGFDDADDATKPPFKPLSSPLFLFLFIFQVQLKLTKCNNNVIIRH